MNHRSALHSAVATAALVATSFTSVAVASAATVKPVTHHHVVAGHGALPTVTMSEVTTLLAKFDAALPHASVRKVSLTVAGGRYIIHVVTTTNKVVTITVSSSLKLITITTSTDTGTGTGTGYHHGHGRGDDGLQGSDDDGGVQGGPGQFGGNDDGPGSGYGAFQGGTPLTGPLAATPSSDD